MMTIRRLHPRFPLGFLLLIFPAFLVTSALSRDVQVNPSGEPGDYDRVRSMLSTLAPGDTLTLARGVFDWSRNLADSSVVALQPGGMPLTRSRIVVRGVRSGDGPPETILRGATDPKTGRPIRPARGTNAAFRNGVNADQVTLEDMVFENFENAVILIQADTLTTATPVDLLKAGTRGWTLQRLTIRGGPFGIMANGRHEDLAIRDCEITLSLPPHQKRGTGPRDGSFAIAVRPYPPAYNGLPVKVTIERNRAVGPDRKGETEMFGGLILTSRHGRMVGNSAVGWGLGLVVEGDSLTVTGNRIDDCRIGIVAWSTERLGTSTAHATIADNSISHTSRQGSGFLADFSGTAIFLAGLQDSRLLANRFSGNAGPDIVFGGLTGTKPSAGNVLLGNGGSVVLSAASLKVNQISGSELRVLGERPNPVIPSDTTKVGGGKP